MCVWVSVVFIPPPSRSLSISRLWGAFEWVSVGVCVAEKRGRQSKGVSLGLLVDAVLFILKTWNKKKSERRLILFFSISKCRGACREVKELEKGEQSAQKVRKLPSSRGTGALGFYRLKLFFLSLDSLDFWSLSSLEYNCVKICRFSSPLTIFTQRVDAGGEDGREGG